MKRLPLLVVAALLGLAVSMSAQNRQGAGQSRASTSVRQQSHRGQAALPARSVRTSQNVRRVSRGQATRISQSRVSSIRPSRSAKVGHVSHNRVKHVARTVGRALNSAPLRIGFGGAYFGYNCGRYVTRCERVLVPGYWGMQYHAATYGWVYDSCGHRSWGVVEPAHHDRVWFPARYETQSRQVWVRY